MSLVFSDTSNENGIIQVIERNLFGDDGIGRITGSASLLKQFTSEVNLAYSRLLGIIFKADGRADYDDSNHTDYPIITTNIVQGQKDYPLTTDGSGNLVLEYKKAAVLSSATATTYDEIEPFDELEDRDNAIVTGDTNQGVPSRYGLIANGIFFDVAPSYSATNGLKLFVNREQTFFLTTDTTKKPGFAGLYHEYLALRPSAQYAKRNLMSSAPTFESDSLRMEREVEDFYARRNQDERKIFTPKITNYV